MSTQLMTALESSPVNLNSAVGLTPVCIDNEEIREQILTANKIDISTVPCILIVYRNGGIEKYEGGRALQWIEETVRKYMQPPPPSIIHTPPQPKLPSPPLEHPKRMEKSRTHVEYASDTSDVSESSDEECIKQPKSHKKRYKSKRTIQKRSKPVKTVVSTSIEDLDSEEEQNLPRRPPVGIRNGPSNYEISEEFGNAEEPNRDMTKKMKQSTLPATGKGNDLMSAAMAMQKERESVDTKSPRPPVGNFVTNQRPI